MNIKTDNQFAMYKRRILALCVASYTISYLCRTNLSIVLDNLILELDITKTAAGLMGTTYFWCYAIGQIVSGGLAEKFNPKYLIAIGLGMSALINITIGLSESYMAVIVLWSLNGVFLSMVWAPTVKIASNWFSHEEYNKVSILLSLPTTIGYLLSWSIIGIIVNTLDWRMAFFVPSACATIFIVIWLFKMKPTPKSAGFNIKVDTGGSLESGMNVSESKNEIKLIKVLFTGSMIALALITVTQGAIRESINLWAPTLLKEVDKGISPNIISGFISIIPIVSTCGVLFTGYAVKRFKNAQEKVLLLFLIGGCLFSWSLVAFKGIFGVVLGSMSLMMGVLCGTTVILTTLVPLRFAKYNKSALVSGIFNFLAYVGAALGGVVAGAIGEMWGWPRVYLMWAILTTLALGVMILFGRKNKVTVSDYTCDSGTVTRRNNNINV